MELPQGVDFPAGFEQEKSVRKLFKTIFNKNYWVNYFITSNF